MPAASAGPVGFDDPFRFVHWSALTTRTAGTGASLRPRRARFILHVLQLVQVAT